MTNSFYSKIVGTTFERPGQELKGIDIIPTLNAGQELKLVPEPENKFDRNAIAVYTDNLHIGYIPKETAAGMKEAMMQDVEYKCEVSEITGGGDRNYGCNIKITGTDRSNEKYNDLI